VNATHGRLGQVADEPLVLVDARVVSPAAVAETARAHPASQFALVGASARAEHVANLTGVVLKESDAAYLAGIVAGLAAVDLDGARVAWVGPQERPLAAAFTRGVHASARSVTVLRQWTRAVPARCKEAALTSFDRGAVVVMAHGGLCAAAAADAAHDHNLPALSLDDFLLRSVAAGRVARDASAGVFHGGQDVIFGVSTGAVGVRTLDPRISPDTVAQARAAAQAFAGAGGRAG
jgi:basic membrane lipoprotein Med (substrate-binding protein (PBP1-ABC) superfamily)